MHIQLENKVAIVTGASTGIGRAIALALAESGARVVVNYYSNENAALEVARTIQAKGQAALAIPADVTQKQELDAMVQQVLANFGSRIDILVNNAGSMIQRRPIMDLDEETIDKVFAVNVKGVIFCTQAVLPYMGQGGRIINISSIAARTGGGGGAVHYAAAKGAVNTLTWGMALELRQQGILVNAVAPGLIQTPFHEKFTHPEHFEKMKKNIPIGREGQPDEIAAAVVFLASDYASYLMGEIIEVNGGWWMG
jgi:NAD(P)-dependent dehydrogenase (short-subunit alcohol dehydrogenase family)